MGTGEITGRGNRAMDFDRVYALLLLALDVHIKLLVLLLQSSLVFLIPLMHR